MERLDELEAQITEELQQLATTLDDYERTLASVDGTLSESTLDGRDSSDRHPARSAE